ncbi:hypothetical protein ACJX0J_036808, partial [Zea mays]
CLQICAKPKKRVANYVICGDFHLLYGIYSGLIFVISFVNYSVLDTCSAVFMGIGFASCEIHTKKK